jgi:hypothetical protein
VLFARTAPLPRRFIGVKLIDVNIAGRHRTEPLLSGRRVRVVLRGLACGTYPIVFSNARNSRKPIPVLRIWQLVGGRRLIRAGFPLVAPPIGLSFRRGL